MGVDIHGITQISRSERWETIEEIPKAFENGFRFSEWFSFLRQNFDRGYPLEAEGKWFLEDDGYYRAEFTKEDDGIFYGDGYLTYKDICGEVDKIQRKLSVTETWWRKFKELGGKLPEGMGVADDCCGDGRVYFCIEEGEDYGIEYWITDTMYFLGKMMKKYKAQDARIIFNFDC